MGIGWYYPYMGLVIGMAVGPVFFWLLVFIFLKLILDAISDQISAHPFRLLPWWLVILLICVATVLTYLLTGDINLKEAPTLAAISAYSTLFGIILLPVLGIYGLVKLIVRWTRR